MAVLDLGAVRSPRLPLGLQRSAMDPPARHGEILTQSVRRGAAVGASVGGAVVAVPGAVAGGVPGGSFPGLFCSDQFPCSADLQ